MKKIGQIISLEIYDCSNIKSLKSRDEKSRFIMQGENFCKIYDKIKGVDYSLTQIENKMLFTASFDVEYMKNHLDTPKFVKFMESIKDQQNIKLMKNIWQDSMQNSEELIEMSSLGTFEQKFKYKSHVTYPADSINLNNDYICTYSKNSISFNKKKDACIYKKYNGGIILNCDNMFIADYLL